MTMSIQKYWDTRAASNRHAPTATTNDIHLRTLEARTLIHHISERVAGRNASALDVGCGDGRTTLAVAQRCQDLRIIGVDYAAAMIESARDLLSQECGDSDRVQFRQVDVANLSDAFGKHHFDLAFSCRCLINLPDGFTQRRAIEQIASCLSPSGTYFAIENFMEGHDSMNRARRAIGLQEIPVRWHNRYFTEQSLAELIRGVFEVWGFEDFSSAYYYATRVIYAKLCLMRGEEPNYDHDIHRLAVDLPAVGCFSPVRLVRLRRL